MDNLNWLFNGLNTLWDGITNFGNWFVTEEIAIGIGVTITPFQLFSAGALTIWLGSLVIGLFK